MILLLSAALAATPPLLPHPDTPLWRVLDEVIVLSEAVPPRYAEMEMSERTAQETASQRFREQRDTLRELLLLYLSLQPDDAEALTILAVLLELEPRQHSTSLYPMQVYSQIAEGPCDQWSHHARLRLAIEAPQEHPAQPVALLFTDSVRLTAGFDALYCGDLSGAESYFTGRSRGDRLGLAILRHYQGAHDEAEQRFGVLLQHRAPDPAERINAAYFYAFARYDLPQARQLIAEGQALQADPRYDEALVFLRFEGWVATQQEELFAHRVESLRRKTKSKHRASELELAALRLENLLQEDRSCSWDLNGALRENLTLSQDAVERWDYAGFEPLLKRLEVLEERAERDCPRATGP